MMNREMTEAALEGLAESLDKDDSIEGNRTFLVLFLQTYGLAMYHSISMSSRVRRWLEAVPLTVLDAALLAEPDRFYLDHPEWASFVLAGFRRVALTEVDRSGRNPLGSKSLPGYHRLSKYVRDIETNRNLRKFWN